MTAVTMPFLCCEATALALALYLLSVVGFHGVNGTLAAVDALTLTVAGASAVVGVYRVLMLFSFMRSPDPTPSTRAVFALSGCYLTILWAILHFALGIAAPPRSYFFQVSSQLASYERHF